jgi:hypothetical protein
VIVLCGKIAWQRVVNGMIGEPLQCVHWGVFAGGVGTGRFDMYGTPKRD